MRQIPIIVGNKYHFCRDKSFVTTSILLSRQTRVCRRRGKGEEIFVERGQSSDVEPGEHDEQEQGRTAFHKFMQIWGKVYFVGYTARAGTAARFLFEFGFCYEVGLNKMADAGRG